MNIWRFSRLVSGRLLRWSLLSIGVGLLLGRHRDPLWRGIGAQSVGWGAIDALIALGGDVGTRGKIAALDNPGEAAVQEKEKSFLRTVLLINAALDVVYVLGGAWVARRDKGDGVLRGHGVGIILQGGFLFVFDVLHALLIQDVSPDRHHK